MDRVFGRQRVQRDLRPTPEGWHPPSLPVHGVGSPGPASSPKSRVGVTVPVQDCATEASVRDSSGRGREITQKDSIPKAPDSLPRTGRTGPCHQGGRLSPGGAPGVGPGGTRGAGAAWTWGTRPTRPECLHVGPLW